MAQLARSGAWPQSPGWHAGSPLAYPGRQGQDAEHNVTVLPFSVPTSAPRPGIPPGLSVTSSTPAPEAVCLPVTDACSLGLSSGSERATRAHPHVDPYERQAQGVKSRPQLGSGASWDPGGPSPHPTASQWREAAFPVSVTGPSYPAVLGGPEKVETDPREEPCGDVCPIPHPNSIPSWGRGAEGREPGWTSARTRGR